MEGSTYQTHEIKEFNPADVENLVRFCVQELESRRLHELPPPAAFEGAGIYALYYDGDFPLYQHASIRSPERTQPIYVGRARLTASSGVRPLFNRLRQHGRSIEAAENLQIEDFSCRFLVLHPIWVSTVEDLLIEHFDTLWNGVLKGFGVHDPGKERHTGDLPKWDALHRGRDHSKSMLEAGASTPLVDRIESEIIGFTARRSGQGVPAPMTQVQADLVLREVCTADDEA